jgi:hypothetical protein
MSGFTLTEPREALANQIRENIARETTVLPYPRGSLVFPQITVLAAYDYIEPWKTYGPSGEATVHLELELLVGGSNIESAHRRRDDYLSIGAGNTSSIVDALMLDPSCGLAGANFHIAGITATEDDNGVGALLAVEVTIRKIGANA